MLIFDTRNSDLVLYQLSRLIRPSGSWYCFPYHRLNSDLIGYSWQMLLICTSVLANSPVIANLLVQVQVFMYFPVLACHLSLSNHCTHSF